MFNALDSAIHILPLSKKAKEKVLKNLHSGRVVERTESPLVIKITRRQTATATAAPSAVDGVNKNSEDEILVAVTEDEILTTSGTKDETSTTASVTEEESATAAGTKEESFTTAVTKDKTPDINEDEVAATPASTATTEDEIDDTTTKDANKSVLIIGEVITTTTTTSPTTAVAADLADANISVQIGPEIRLVDPITHKMSQKRKRKVHFNNSLNSTLAPPLLSTTPAPPPLCSTPAPLLPVYIRTPQRRLQVINSALKRTMRGMPSWDDEESFLPGTKKFR
jgi:hypothetical protein